MTTDLPTIVRDYLKKVFPDKVGVTSANWIYIWDTSQYPNAGYNYIAQVMDTHILPFWSNTAHRDQMIAQHDLIIKAADPKFFEVLEKLVKSYLKEERNG